MHCEPVPEVEWPGVLAEPTSVAAPAVPHAVTAATLAWHPSAPGDQLDMACATVGLVNGQPVY